MQAASGLPSAVMRVIHNAHDDAIVAGQQYRFAKIVESHARPHGAIHTFAKNATIESLALAVASCASNAPNDSVVFAIHQSVPIIPMNSPWSTRTHPTITAPICAIAKNVKILTALGI